MLEIDWPDSSTIRPPGRRPLRHLKSSTAATSKSSTISTGLWMNSPTKATAFAIDQDKPRLESTPAFKMPTLPAGKSSGHVTVRNRLNLQTNNSRREESSESNSASAATLKSSGPPGLWMNQPVQSVSLGTFDSIKCARDAASFDLEDSTRPTPTSGHVTIRTRLDLQTNNSRRNGALAGGRGGRPEAYVDSNDSGADDYELVSERTGPISMTNTSAVAKGADAMVKNSLSRPTEIIDTSKLVEEGKVSTEYTDEPEIFEEQDRTMIDEYEKAFAYARRLRALLNMKFREVDRGGIETNFQLVKAHEHPTQRIIDRWRNVDFGVSYNEQVKRQKQIEEYRANATKKKGKKGDEPEPIYPDVIRFTVRFRKEDSEKRWKDYRSYRQKQKKMGGSKSSGPVPKPNDKYLLAYLDVWSYCVAVYVKPWATLKDIIDPVFNRVGLERRADFSYTIGCFKNDKRAGKAKIIGVPNLPEPVVLHQLAGELYKTNCTEIYVNDNRCEMFSIFPNYYDPKLIDKPEEQKEKKKGKGKGKDEKNENNASAANPTASDFNANNFEVEGDEEAALSSPSTLGSAARMLSYEADLFEASPTSVSRRCLSVVEETSRDSQQP